jgi:hypothetical protein
MHPLYMNAIFNKQSAKTIARLEKERNAKILSKKLKQNPVQTTYLQKKISDIKTLLGNEITIN